MEIVVFGQVRPSNWSRFFKMFVEIAKFTGTQIIKTQTNKQTDMDIDIDTDVIDIDICIEQRCSACASDIRTDACTDG